MSNPASVRECRWLLRNMGFDRERCNERSALVLLALLGLKPGDPWAESGARSLRTVDIMGWIRDYWDVDYRPNTRETIRRQTLHQFVQAHLVIENPDEPTRPINSPKWCYQVTTQALDLIRSMGLKPWQVRSQMTSHDPDFDAKAADICALYLQPADNWAVFSVDEKTGIQAKSRTSPPRAARAHADGDAAGRPAQQEFEYRRHGTAALFAMG